MPRGPKPTPISLSDDERAKLASWADRPSTAQALALRSRIVLAAAQDSANAAIAAELRLTVPIVRKVARPLCPIAARKSRGIRKGSETEDHEKLKML